MPDQVPEFERCAQRYDVPIPAGSCNYILGAEEQKLADNLRIGSELGSFVHNTQIFMDHAQGHLLQIEYSDDKVAEVIRHLLRR